MHVPPLVVPEVHFKKKYNFKSIKFFHLIFLSFLAYAGLAPRNLSKLYILLPNPAKTHVMFTTDKHPQFMSLVCLHL